MFARINDTLTGSQGLSGLACCPFSVLFRQKSQEADHQKTWVPSLPSYLWHLLAVESSVSHSIYFSYHICLKIPLCLSSEILSLWMCLEAQHEVESIMHKQGIGLLPSVFSEKPRNRLAPWVDQILYVGFRLLQRFILGSVTPLSWSTPKFLLVWLSNICQF